MARLVVSAPILPGASRPRLVESGWIVNDSARKQQWRQEDALPVDAGFIDATAPQKETHVTTRVTMLRDVG